MKTINLKAIPSKLLLKTACAFTLAFSSLFAQTPTETPPERMTIQSYLTDDSGSPVGSPTAENKQMVFYIYDADEGGSVEYADEQIVTVDNGHFSVVLGEGSSLTNINHDLALVFQADDASDRYLEIVVSDTDGSNEQTLSPRLRLLPAAYAFLANFANQAATVTDSSITGDSIADGSISSADLSSGSVTSTVLAGNAVTSAKIADGSITSADIADGTITESDLATNSVESDEIATDAVGTDEVDDGSLLGEDLKTNTLTFREIGPDAITVNELKDGAVTSAKIAGNTITAADIAADAVNSSEIAEGAVGSSEIENNSITKDDLATDSVYGNEIVAGLFEFEEQYVGTVAANSDTGIDYGFTTRKVDEWWPMLIGFNFNDGSNRDSGTYDLLRLSWAKSSSNTWRLIVKYPNDSSNLPDVTVQILWIPSRMVDDYESKFKTKISDGNTLLLE